MKYNIFLIACFMFSVSLVASCQKDQPVSQEYEPVEVRSDWFRVSYLGDKIYSIEEPKSSQGNVSYLILGDNRALMFDTGCGENEVKGDYKIKYILDKITTLPVTLVQSHFHFDHNQNIHEFERIAFPDLPVLKDRVSSEGLFQFTQEDLFEGDYPSEITVDEWFPLETDIDLGGQVIQLVHVPGHSDESVAIRIPSSKMILLGDFLYNGALFLFRNDDLTVYQQTVDHLTSLLSDEYRLFGAHGDPEIEYGQLQKLKDFLICIEDSTCHYTEQTVWGIPAHIYKYQDMHLLVFQQE
jgi:glyoxylase-like metal-dependent hydrolase (beta-lactamase superfamily II)